MGCELINRLPRRWLFVITVALSPAIVLAQEQPERSVEERLDDLDERLDSLERGQAEALELLRSLVAAAETAREEEAEARENRLTRVRRLDEATEELQTVAIALEQGAAGDAQNAAERADALLAGVASDARRFGTELEVTRVTEARRQLEVLLTLLREGDLFRARAALAATGSLVSAARETAAAAPTGGAPRP